MKFSVVFFNSLVSFTFNPFQFNSTSTSLAWYVYFNNKFERQIILARINFKTAKILEADRST